MLRNKQSSIVALSHLPPVTVEDFGVLQETELMLMCHRRGPLKTQFIHLSASTQRCCRLISDHLGARQ